MEHKVYIQSDNGWPLQDWLISAYMGFKEKGATVILFEDIEEIPKSRTNIVVAYIEDTRIYFEKMGIKLNENFSYPAELEKYYGRKIWTSTMGEFKANPVAPVFIKPAFNKQFVSGPVTNIKNIPFLFKDDPEDPSYAPDDAPAILAEMIDFVSEYRCYVADGELLAIQHYMGDIRIFPDVKVIDAALADYTTQSAGFALDFGITRDGKTLVVEANDGWSLGNYGLKDTVYARLLATRWRQIMKIN